MGREEIRNCINNFVKNKAKDFSKTLNWQKIEKDQDRYLFRRKLFRFLSVGFNKLMAK